MVFGRRLRRVLLVAGGGWSAHGRVIDSVAVGIAILRGLCYQREVESRSRLMLGVQRRDAGGLERELWTFGSGRCRS